jgi:hypothetical protein
MPPRDFYSGLTQGDALRKFADHHYETGTRHISRDEYELLIEIARLLDQDKLRRSA